MSSYCTDYGKIKRVERLPGESIDQLKERLWREKHIGEEYPEDGFDDDWDLYEKYIITKHNIWEIFDHIEADEADDMFCEFENLGNGVYGFHTRYYNGGTCMSEMIEDAITEKMENEVITEKIVSDEDRLIVLKEVQFMFNLHSDMSSRCNGYNSLCEMIKKLEK